MIFLEDLPHGFMAFLDVLQRSLFLADCTQTSLFCYSFLKVNDRFLMFPHSDDPTLALTAVR
jgi:hypothetical protein